MTNTRTLTISTIAAVLLAGGAATQAGAASVAAQETIRPPEQAPVTFPGADKRKGQALRSGERVISRAVTLTGREKTAFSVRCPSGTTHAGLGVRDGETRIGFNVLRPLQYTGKRSVRVEAYGRVARGRRVTGKIYALCR